MLYFYFIELVQNAIKMKENEYLLATHDMLCNILMMVTDRKMVRL